MVVVNAATSQTLTVLQARLRDRPPAKKEALSHGSISHCRGRWTQSLLPRGWRPQRSGRVAAPRLSDILPYVPEPDSAPRGALSRGGAGSSGIRLLACAGTRTLPAHV